MKNEKKLLCFTNAKLINKLLKDLSFVEKKTESTIVEQILLDKMLPKNKKAADIVKNYLYGENGGIGYALHALFSLNAAGCNWEAVHTNYLNLVKYAMDKEILANSHINENSEIMPHCSSQLRSLIEKFNRLSDENKDNLELKIKYKKDAEFVEYLSKELEEEPQFSHLCNFYSVIIKNWDVLNNWTITFRLLSDLVLLEGNWPESCENRTELLNIINQTSLEW